MKHPVRGFSLIELMTAILVLGVLLGMAIPSYREMTRNNRVAGAQNDLITALATARSEALHRSRPVSVCASANGTSCGATTDWVKGWIVFTDTGTAGSVDGTDAVLQAWAIPDSETRITSAVTFVRYGITGMLATAGTQFIDVYPYACTGDKVRRVTVSTVGSPSLTKQTCS